MKQILSILFLFISISCKAQVTWERYIDFDSTNMVYWGARPYTVHQTLDNGFIVAGSTGFSTNLHIYTWVKFDSTGNYLWAHMSNGGHNSNIWSIAEDKDSNIYLCGTSYGFPGDLPIPIIYKSDKNGNIIWQKYLTGNDISEAHRIITTFDGGIILLANTSKIPNPLDYNDIVLVKADSSGNVQWSKTYGQIDREVGHSMVETSDSGFIISGFTHSFGNRKMLILRTDSLGNLLWSKSLTGINFYEGISIIQTSDLNFVAVGSLTNFLNGPSGSAIVKLYPNGDTIWIKSIGDGDTLILTTVIEDNDQNLILIGLKGYGSGSCQIIKSDSSGNPIWTRLLGKTNYLANCSIGELTSDRGFIIIGTDGFGNLGAKKINGNGSNSCDIAQTLPIVNYPGVQVSNAQLIVTTDTILLNSQIYFEAGPGDSILIDNCSPLSISEKDYSNIILKIFPNPTSSQFMVRCTQLENGRLSIYTPIGTKIFSSPFTDSMILDFSYFPKGIYYVRVSNSEKNLTQKLIIE